MGIFRNGLFPYSNYQNLNLDWILGEVQRLANEWAQYHADWEQWKNDTNAAFQSLHDYVMNYFDNLDVSEEISAKLDEMAADGTLSELLAPFVADYQRQLNLLEDRVDNLTETITPGTTTGDAEIIDARVGADGVTYSNLGNAIRGQYLKSLHLDNTSTFTSCDDVPVQNIIFVSSSGGILSIPDFPFSVPGTLICLGHRSFPVQVAFGYNNNRYKYRVKNGSTWTSWTEFKIEEILHINSNNVYTSCDDVPTQTITFVSSSGGVLTIPDFPYPNPGTLICLGNNNFPVQMAFGFLGDKFAYRVKNSYGWTAWTYLESVVNIKGTLNASGSTIQDLNDITENSVYFVSTNQGESGIANYPFRVPAMIKTIVWGRTGAWQIGTPYEPVSEQIKYRVKQGQNWTQWFTIGGGTTTIVQEVSRDTYNNEYNINVSPQITTDANYWLQPVDTESADETNKTDMTSAIMAMLNNNGYCKLAPGIFYVSGNIDMPAGSTLEGCGKKTIIRLLQSAGDNYIIRMHTKSTLKNVCLSGSYNPLDISTVSVGGRNGVQYIGNRDGETPTITPRTCTNCIIEGCYFENLDSGIYGYNAGGGVQEGLMVNDCYFERCKVGINIDYWTEYCKFTNCVIYYCHYACINNGGNNTFTACTFHGIEGFIIDNSGDNKPNNGHGTLNGCTINHIDNINHPDTLGGGLGIKIINTSNGFVISNCQLWYSKVYVERSSGVLITGCEFGGNTPELEITGTDYAFIEGCLFKAQPQKTFTAPVRIENSYTFTGEAISA